jgi:hypothetical protein
LKSAILAIAISRIHFLINIKKTINELAITVFKISQKFSRARAVAETGPDSALRGGVGNGAHGAGGGLLPDGRLLASRFDLNKNLKMLKI